MLSLDAQGARQVQRRKRRGPETRESVRMCSPSRPHTVSKHSLSGPSLLSNATKAPAASQAVGRIGEAASASAQSDASGGRKGRRGGRHWGQHAWQAVGHRDKALICGRVHAGKPTTCVCLESREQTLKHTGRKWEESGGMRCGQAPGRAQNGSTAAPQGVWLCVTKRRRST
jgi:hypothetical protein